jgi:two-component system, NtrC family, response regulator AtoC
VPRHGEVVLGRGIEADVTIDHVTVSRRHASLILGEDTLRIVDHGSFNGTRIGGKKLAPNLPENLGIATIAELGETMVVVQVEGPNAVMRSQGAISSIREPMPGLSAPMQHLYKLVDNVAQSNITVIVRGETGSGKEVVAEEIHKRSERTSGPLIKLNCAALPEQLLEGELFGYERGAFTGATTAKPGLIEAAHGGTLFLDEVGELPLATQAKLLRVVESREVMRLGSLKPKSVDIRLVAATHRDLETMVQTGAFREDLYYRLNGVSLEIPPLRERVEEIPRLANELAARFCKDSKRPTVPISDAAMAMLKTHTWPGNVRELRNVIERALVFCKGVAITPEHLGVLAARRERSSGMPPQAQPQPQPPPPPPFSPPFTTPSSGVPMVSSGAEASIAGPQANMSSTAFGATQFSPAPTYGSAPPQAYVPATPASGPSLPYSSSASDDSALSGGRATEPPAPASPMVGAGTIAFGSAASLPDEVGALERERILQALERCDGNQTQAAEMLGISRRTLVRRLDEYGFPRPRKA